MTLGAVAGVRMYYQLLKIHARIRILQKLLLDSYSEGKKPAGHKTSRLDYPNFHHCACG